MISQGSLSVGVCGIGGFAASIAQFLLANGPDASPPVRLTAVCDPRWREMPDAASRLRQAGIAIDDSFDRLLAREDLAAVWLPLPIDLHRPFTERALDAGKHVMCEKPAAGCIDDVDAMIAARDRSGLSVLIGFQDVYDPATAQVKRLVLDGAIGEVTHATLHASWPRGETYFSRSTWAGRIRRDGAWVLDSPANNALSHYINLLLLLMGDSMHASASPVSIEAELYRAAPIENYDTISARATLASGATALVLLTHAAARETEPIIRVHGTRGLVERAGASYRVVTPEGEQRISRADTAGVYRAMIDTWARAITGKLGPDRLAGTIEIARQHTLLVCGASEATPVHTIPAGALDEATNARGDRVVVIPGIEAVFDQCASENRMLHEIGRYDFTQPAGSFDLRGYDQFSGGLTPTGAAATEV